MEGDMPVKEATDCAAVLQRTKSVLIRLDSERAQLKTDRASHNKCFLDSVNLIHHIDASDPALVKVAELRKMVIRLEGAYKQNSIALEDSADLADDTAGKNRVLGIFYCCVALGKIMDVVAAVTGTGKWVTSTKTAFIDIAESMRDKKDGLPEAQAANITLIMVKETDFLKSVDSLQAILSSIIELCKDAKTALNAPADLAKVKCDTEQWGAKIGALCVKGFNVLQRITKLYDEYLKLADKMPPAFDPKRIAGVPTSWWGDPAYRMRMTDWFAAIKAGLDAIVNFYQAYLAFRQASYDAQSATESRDIAGRNMTSQGFPAIPFQLQIDTWAGLTQADFVAAIHFVNSAPDAHHLNDDLRVLAQQFTRQAETMRMSVSSVQGRVQPSREKLDQTIATLETTDAELAALRKELVRFSAQIVDVRGGGVKPMDALVDRNKELEKLGVPAFLGFIDMERRKIQEDLTSPN
jgi:hypothetical protein